MGNKLQVAYSNRFLTNFGKLDLNSHLVIREAIKKLAEDPRHPSLRTKRVQGTRFIWECSASVDLRITWQYDGHGVILARNCGHLDRVLSNP